MAEPKEAITLLESEAPTLPQIAVAMEVTDQGSHDAAVAFGLRLDEFIDRVHDVLDPICEATNKAHKAATSQRAKLLDPAQKAKGTISDYLSAFLSRMREKQRLEEARLAEEARKKAEETKLQAAVEAEQAGVTKEEVEQFLQQPLALAPVEAPPQYQADKSIYQRAEWDFEVKDFWALVKAAAKDKTLLAYLLPHNVAIRQRVKADKDLCNLPGIRVFERSGVVFR